MKRRDFVKMCGALPFLCPGNSFLLMDWFSASKVCAHPWSKEHLGAPLSGIAALDGLIGGVNPGEVTLLLGRPGMGKSVLANAIVWHVVSQQKKSVAYYSLEISKAQLMKRIVEVGDKAIADEVFSPVDNGGQRLLSHLIIEDQTQWDLKELRRSIQSLKGRGSLHFVVIDYLQLLLPAENDSISLREKIAALCDIAKNENISILILGQLNRFAKGRIDPRPGFEDLQNFAELNELANVLVVHRSSYFNRGDDRKELEIHSALFVGIGSQRKTNNVC